MRMTHSKIKYIIEVMQSILSFMLHNLLFHTHIPVVMLKIKLLFDEESMKYSKKAIPGLMEKIEEKEVSLNSSSEKSYQEWTQKRVNFLRSKVKYDFLTDVTENAKHCKDLCHISLRDKQALDNLKQRLHCSKDDSFYRLLDPNAQKSKNSEHVTKVIKTEMRDNMIQTLQDLMKHYSAHSNHNADIIKNLAEVEKIASDLVIFIKNDLECIQKIENYKNSKYNEQEHKNVDQQTKIKFEEHIRTLNEIVNIHLINRVPEFHHCQANHLAAKVTYLI